MESIIQKDKEKCYVCKGYENGDHLDLHHIFFGASRKNSDKYGLTVYLHHNKCHIFGKNAVHQNSRINRRLQAFAQRKAMKYYGWTMEEWREIFRKNYMEE